MYRIKLSHGYLSYVKMDGTYQFSVEANAKLWKTRLAAERAEARVRKLHSSWLSPGALVIEEV